MVQKYIQVANHANNVVIEDNTSNSDKLAVKMCFSDKYLQTHGTSKQMKEQRQCEKI